MQKKKGGMLLGWLKSIRNRRIRPRRQRIGMHQLDVKVNSRQARRKRSSMRWASIAKVTAMIVGFAGVGVSVKWVYDQIFFENSEFKLNRLSVITGGALTESNIVTAARIELGMNLMEIDLVEVQNRISNLPMVTKAKVSRELPDRLEIVVEERQPIAWLASPRHDIPPRNSATGFLLDNEGRVFRCQHLLKRFMSLPVIGTNDISKPAENTVIESRQVAAAIDLLEKSAAMFEGMGLEIHLVKLENPWSLQAVYNNGMEVTFGIREVDRGLADLQQITSHSESVGRELATVNVLVARNIPVTFFNPPDPELLRQMNGGNSSEMAPEGTAANPIRATPISPEERGRTKQLKSILNGG